MATTITHSKRMAEMRIFNVPEDIRKALKVMAVKQGVTMNQKVIEIFKEYLEKAGELPLK